jgi:hypothetical protein
MYREPDFSKPSLAGAPGTLAFATVLFGRLG